jgi:hypothetical protein
MAEVWVTCIDKNPHEGTHLEGKKWKWKQLIASIEARRHAFRVNVAGRVGELGIVEGPHGKFLRTISEGPYSDSLHTLGEHP